MKRFIILLSVLALVSIGMLGCQKKTVEPAAPAVEVKEPVNGQTAVQEGEIAVTDEEGVYDENKK